MLFSIKDLSVLQETEEIYITNFKLLKENIELSQVWTTPIIIERKNMAILDGHHRYNVAKALNFKRIPCCIVDYTDKRITVGSWRQDIKIDKALVIEYIKDKKKFKAKTTRHKFDFIIPKCNIPFTLLL